MKFSHFLFTRFNLLDDNTSIYNNPAIPDPHEWMEHRMNLFETYTLPSIRAQTNQNFTWLLSFDHDTPKEQWTKYLPYYNIMPIFSYHRTWLNDCYRNRVLNDGDWLITTRLDNDDMLEMDYIAEIQKRFSHEFLIIDTDGVQWDLKTNKYYTTERRRNNSPFMSFVERVGTDWRSPSGLITDPVKTVFYCSHTNMPLHFPSIKVPKRLYRMVIHDRNIANKIVGHEIK